MKLFLSALEEQAIPHEESGTELSLVRSVGGTFQATTAWSRTRGILVSQRTLGLNRGCTGKLPGCPGSAPGDLDLIRLQRSLGNAHFKAPQVTGMCNRDCGPLIQ